MPLLICPNCDASMREMKRNKVSFDICPQCRGVWMDKGELETLMNNVLAERAASQALSSHSGSRDDDSGFSRRRRRDDDDDESALSMVLDLLR